MVDNIDSDEFILELNLFLGKMYVNEEKGILSPEDLEGREVIFNIFIRPKISFLNSYLLKFISSMDQQQYHQQYHQQYQQLEQQQ
jgi:hypothetical protein